jgi:hypothetical protein
MNPGRNTLPNLGPDGALPGFNVIKTFLGVANQCFLQNRDTQPAESGRQHPVIAGALVKRQDLLVNTRHFGDVRYTFYK